MRTPPVTAGFEDGAREHKSRDTGNSRDEKDKEMEFPLELPKRQEAHLDLGSIRNVRLWTIFVCS